MTRAHEAKTTESLIREAARLQAILAQTSAELSAFAKQLRVMAGVVDDMANAAEDREGAPDADRR